MDSLTISHDWIAFVDDDPFILAALRRTTRGILDQQVEFCQAAHQLWEQTEPLHAQPPLLVVTDNQMPDVSGWSLLAQVAVRYPHALRIIVSGSPPTFAEASSGLAHQFWLKPCAPDGLQRLLQAWQSARHYLPTNSLRRLLQLRAPLYTYRPYDVASVAMDNGQEEISNRLRRDLGFALVTSRVCSQLAARPAEEFDLKSIVGELGVPQLQQLYSRSLPIAHQDLPSGVGQHAVERQTWGQLSQEWETHTRHRISWSDPTIHHLVGRWLQVSGYVPHTDPTQVGSFLTQLWQLTDNACSSLH